MPFDPLSIIGYFSTTLGIISFLASGVENVHKRWLNYKDYPTSYKQYYYRIQTAKVVYNSWLYTWTQDDEPFSDADYRYLWGEQGYIDAQKLKAIVQERLEEAIKILQFHSGDSVKVLNDHQMTVWRRFTKGLLSEVDLDQRLPGIRKKICYALYQHANFESNLSNLKNAVDDLLTYSSTAYRNQRLDSDTSSPKEDLKLKHRLDEWSQFMRELHRWQHTPKNGQPGQWQLELQAADSQQLLDRLKDDLEVEVNLAAAGEEDVSTLASILWCSGATLQGNLIVRATLRGGSAPTPFADILKAISSNREALAATHLERIQAALRLVNWALALWGTSWTSRLCTCDLHYTSQGDDTFRMTLRSICQTGTPRRREYGYLGLALAELLTTDIHHMLELAHIHPDVDMSTIVLEDVVKKFDCYSRHAKAVVQYCFAMDRRAENGGQLTPAEFERDVEKIFKPLQKHYKTLSDHREMQRKRHKWYRDLLDQSGIQNYIS